MIVQINNISCRVVVDAGANVSIIREDFVKNSKVKIIWMPPCVSLQTVTGNKIHVHMGLPLVSNISDKTRTIQEREVIAACAPVTCVDQRCYSQDLSSYDLVKDLLQDTDLDEKQRDASEEPLSSPWTSPTVFVKTKDDSTRFSVDCRRLNNVSKMDIYSLPRIDDTLDTLTDDTWFPTLDLKSGYWQVEIHPEDKWMTFFTTPQGLWQFKIMPFGLCDSPATFKRLMETVLGEFSYEACLVYLDDIIIVERSFKVHLNNIRRVVQKLKETNLKLSLSKCHLFRREVTSLVHIILAESVQTDPDKILAVKDWNCPTDVPQLRSFLDLCTRSPDAPLVPEEYVEKLQARMEEMRYLARYRFGMASEKKKA
ncbi:retrovirus-related Pol polyprotein from transposon 297 [Trichonephila clavipes]|uniref:Retrovirus-related Pol polyprotein from transposon 297 n=1 Tax=Trichonephila clavipes TaxID=2585209 RepID=A0A8X6W4I9_TRICX|nr:retrovirus-related Pol polyprotein from transposon 297 [Trichonephila clavipes]